MKKKLIETDKAYTAKVEALLLEMDNYDEVTLNRQPPNGGWSPIQVMYHLILSEELSMQYVQKKMSFENNYPRTGLKETWRSFLLWSFLKLPIKWPAPEKIGGDPEVLPKYSGREEVTLRWRTIRAKWADFIAKMPDDIAGRTVYKHPRGGKLGWLHMYVFFSTHLARHRMQIKKALGN